MSKKQTIKEKIEAMEYEEDLTKTKDQNRETIKKINVGITIFTNLDKSKSYSLWKSYIKDDQKIFQHITFFKNELQYLIEILNELKPTITKEE